MKKHKTFYLKKRHKRLQTLKIQDVFWEQDSFHQTIASKECKQTVQL